MARRQLSIYFQDIEESIELIEQYSSGINQIDFEANPEKQDAVLRRLAIIGEAIKNIPNEFRAKYPDMPWREAAGLRDVVIHEYFGVSLEVIWNVIIKELPPLKLQIQTIRRELAGA